MSRQPTVEWQVAGLCNYGCSYCIQSRASRTGHPSPEEIEQLLAFFAGLPGGWEIKMSGGEPFAFESFVGRIVPGLIERTRHTISVLTNLSAPLPVLERFARLTRGRLGIVSASLHLEFAPLAAFVAKTRAFRELLDPAARMVVNKVLVPGRLEEALAAREALEAAGLRFFPQLMKTKHGLVEYGEDEQPLLRELLGAAPTPRQANLAPSYRGRRCWTGVDYFVLTQRGEAWSCRTARRFGEGRLGDVLAGEVRRGSAPRPCPYDICPCTVPANRGMIEGLAAAEPAP